MHHIAVFVFVTVYVMSNIRQHTEREREERELFHRGVVYTMRYMVDKFTLYTASYDQNQSHVFQYWYAKERLYSHGMGSTNLICEFNWGACIFVLYISCQVVLLTIGLIWWTSEFGRKTLCTRLKYKYIFSYLLIVNRIYRFFKK